MNYFLNYKYENEKKHNFKSLLDRTYLDKNTVNCELKLGDKFYKSLKEFYSYFNYESHPKTFTEKIYSKYKMEKLRIITEQDLIFAFPEIYEKKIAEILTLKNKGLLDAFIFKFFQILNFDIPSKKAENTKLILKNRPVEWNLFYKIAEEFVSKNNLKESELDENMKDFSILLEKKDLDFQYYQSMYKRTKRNIFYSMIRDLFYSSRDTNSNVLE